MSENQNSEERKTSRDTSLTQSYTEDQYREYYLKFVDLVVVREITAAAGARESIQ